MEHHSNIVPWQLLCEERGAQAARRADRRSRRADDRRVRAAADARARRSSRSSHMSNALGTINPVPRSSRLAHARGVAGPDRRRRRPRTTCAVDVAGARLRLLRRSRATSCTARPASACSTASEALLEAMPPFMGGGDMISSVTFERARWNELPYKFEAGTPHIAGAIGLGAAIDYIDGDRLRRRSPRTSASCWSTAPRSLQCDCRRPHRSARRGDKASILSFVHGRRPSARHRHDRRPRRRRDSHRPSLRAAGDGSLRHPGDRARSLALYNTREEIDALGRALDKVREVFALMSDLERSLPGSHPRPQQAAEELPRASTPSQHAPKATTRCAAIA